LLIYYLISLLKLSILLHIHLVWQPHPFIMQLCRLRLIPNVLESCHLLSVSVLGYLLWPILLYISFLLRPNRLSSILNIHPNIQIRLLLLHFMLASNLLKLFNLLILMNQLLFLLLQLFLLLKHNLFGPLILIGLHRILLLRLQWFFLLELIRIVKLLLLGLNIIILSRLKLWVARKWSAFNLLIKVCLRFFFPRIPFHLRLICGKLCRIWILMLLKLLVLQVLRL